jgi:membrane fusion protein, multidrug efflux system
MQSLKLILNSLALAAMLAALAGCSRESGGPSGAPISKSKGPGLPVPVLAAAAVRKDFPIELSAIGNVRAFASVTIKARVDGQLSTIQVKQGDEVKRGATVFEIDSRPFKAALMQAQAIQARDEASLKNAEVDMRRTDDLADTKAVSASLVDANRAKVASLRATVAADQAAVETATLQLSFCTVASPINGRIGLLDVDAGNMVKNNDTVLAVVNQTSPIYVDFAVPEQSLAAVRSAAAVGPLRVQATAPSQDGPAAVGELKVVDNQVDQTTGTVLLRAVFPNVEEQLWPGQFVNVSMEIGKVAGAVVVPAPAIQVCQEGDFVFVVKADSTVEKRLVKLGPARNGETVIEQGIQPGDTVVTDGQLRLVPGAKADVKQPAQPAPAETGSGRPA